MKQKNRWDRSKYRHYLYSGSLLCAFLINGSWVANAGTSTVDDVTVVTQSTKTIRGTIVDTGGLPVIGASISVKGTTQGTISDMNGTFTLDVSENAVLEISYIGYLSQTIKVGASTNLNIVLKEDTQALDEVVVVGYGVQKKSVMTAAISRVTSDDLEKLTPTRVEDVLRGKVSGISITQNSGQPGTASRVRIRGTGTINNSDPLYIVDGVPLESGIDYLNPLDIQSVEVLKDAASAAIYGSRAANGVILVTTKNGSKGKAVVNYDFSIGWQNPWRKLSVLNATEYETIMNEAYVNAGMDPIYDNPSAAGVGTNWQDEIYNENAPIMNHQASISGGGEKGTYFLSFGYLDQEGIVQRSDYKRYTFRFNNTYQIFENKNNKFFRGLKVGANLGYTRIMNKGISENDNFSGPLSSAVMTPPNKSVYLENPTAEEIAYYDQYYPGYVTDPDGRIYTVIENQEIVNPKAMLETWHRDNDADKFIGTIWGELEFFKDLTFRTSLSTDMAFWGYRNWYPVAYLSYMQKTEESRVEQAMNRGVKLLWENTVNYKFNIEKHNFNVLLGTSMERYDSKYLTGTAQNLRAEGDHTAWVSFTNSATPGDQHTSGGASEHRMASVFGRVNYNFNERYMLEVTLRRDGSSNFGTNNRFAYFPSVSAGWTLTNEPFMENKPGWFDFLKIRGSWGQNGNENIDAFGYTTTMVGSNNYTFGAGSNGVIHSGTRPSSMANPDLKWETSEQLDFGFDSRFFNSALSFSFDWFKKDTKDMLLTRPIPTYVGSGSPLANVGTLTNQGIEFEVGYKLNVDKVNLSFLANASYVKNEVKNIGNQTGYIDRESLPTYGTITRDQNGYPIGYFFGYQALGIFQNQEEIDNYISPTTGKPIQPDAKPGDVKFADLNGDGVISDDNEDRTMIGKPNPDWTVGFTFTADWNGFDLSAFFQGSFGADVFDALRRFELADVNYTSDVMNRWHGEGTSYDMPRIVLGDTPKNFRPSTLLVHDASFVRLRNLQVGYTLPASLTRKAHIQRLRFYASFDNLLTITGYKGMDPEIGSTMGIDKGVYPQARAYTVGLNLSF